MRNQFFLFLLACGLCTPLRTMDGPGTPIIEEPTVGARNFFDAPENNFLLAGGGGAITLGLGSLAHKYYREMRQLDNMLALAALEKQQATNRTEHEIADQRLANTLRRRRKAYYTALFLGVPAGLFGTATTALLGRGVWLLP